jgi:hypothetical protein
MSLTENWCSRRLNIDRAAGLPQATNCLRIQPVNRVIPLTLTFHSIKVQDNQLANELECSVDGPRLTALSPTNPPPAS